MRFTPAIAALAVALGFAADDVRATTISVIDSNQGTVTQVVPGRDDPNEAIAADGTFFSLGLSDLGDTGFIAFDISPAGDFDFTLTEVTTKCNGVPGCDNHFETADVWVGGPSDYLGGGATTNMMLLDSVTNGEAQAGKVFSGTGIATILVIDTTPAASSDSFDGFDVDGLAVDRTTPIPLPAAGWLLIGALTGVGILGRRRSA